MRSYFVFFLVSGFCGLVYQVVWLRLAMAAFGVTTPAVSLVLSVFMAGLAIGSWLVGRLARRLETAPAAVPLKLYCVAELLIATSGLAVPLGMDWGREFLTGVDGVAWNSSSYYVASGFWIALTLLPFCIGMGATFPLAMAAIRREMSAVSETSFSYLYLANVLGATSGAALSAFVLIELLGFRGTLLVAAMLNVSLAAAAFLRSRVARAAGVHVEATTPFAVATAGQPQTPILLWLFLTGLVSMALEVVWIRQFTPYLGTLVYAFAAILVVYLLATLIGSRVYRWRPEPARPVLLAWIVLGLLALLPLAATDPRLSIHGAVRSSSVSDRSVR